MGLSCSLHNGKAPCSVDLRHVNTIPGVCSYLFIVFVSICFAVFLLSQAQLFEFQGHPKTPNSLHLNSHQKKHFRVLGKPGLKSLHLGQPMESHRLHQFHRPPVASLFSAAPNVLHVLDPETSERNVCAFRLDHQGMVPKKCWRWLKIASGSNSSKHLVEVLSIPITPRFGGLTFLTCAHVLVSVGTQTN